MLLLYPCRHQQSLTILLQLFFLFYLMLGYSRCTTMQLYKPFNIVKCQTFIFFVILILQLQQLPLQLNMLYLILSHLQAQILRQISQIQSSRQIQVIIGCYGNSCHRFHVVNDQHSILAQFFGNNLMYSTFGDLVRMTNLFWSIACVIPVRNKINSYIIIFKWLICLDEEVTGLLRTPVANT